MATDSIANGRAIQRTIRAVPSVDIFDARIGFTTVPRDISQTYEVVPGTRRTRQRHMGVSGAALAGEAKE